MASTYSALKIELMGTGDQPGTWGATTNTNLGTALEQAVVGRATATFPADSDLTLTLTDTNATQVARHFILNVISGVALTSTRNLIVPTINKPYIIENNTTGGQSIIVKTSSGTGVTVPNGRTTMVYADSVNVVSAENYKPSLALGTALPVTSGGTGVTTSTGTGSNVLNTSPTISNAALTGIPTAPTASVGTNTTQLASTAFVINQVAASVSGVSTFSAGTTGLTPSTATSGAVTLGGTLAVANGGTGTTTSTGTGSVVRAVSPALTGATFNGYTEKVTTIGLISTSTFNLDISTANIFDITLGDNVTLTFTNTPAAGFSHINTLIVRQPPTSPGKTLTVTGAIYTDGTLPILSTGANQIDVLTFWSIDGGTVYFGTFAMANVS
jgi:hypothetical protein